MEFGEVSHLYNRNEHPSFPCPRNETSYVFLVLTWLSICVRGPSENGGPLRFPQNQPIPVQILGIGLNIDFKLLLSSLLDFRKI